MLKSIKKLFGGNDEPQSAAKSETTGSSEATANSDMSSDMMDAESARPASQAPQIDLPPPTPAELKLEALFAHAAHEPGKRNDFLQALMEAELLVIGQTSPAEDGTTNVQLATQMAGEEPVTLAFTSKAALALAGAPPDQPFIKIRTVDLVRMIAGQLGFVLNPGSRVGKHFTKFEVQQLAGQTGPSVREVPVQGNVDVMIGQPNAYPPGLREALASAVKESQRIRAIHTGLMSAGEEQPVLLAVISTEEEIDREEFMTLINELSAATAGTLGNQPINFAPINPSFEDLITRRALVDVFEEATV